jgi:predicted Zn finger-like uncharacterized protein
MSLKTRCPACDTVFKIVPDQLKVSKGWVRCGRCAEVFDAAAHAATSDEASPWPQSTPQAVVAISPAIIAEDTIFTPENIAPQAINTPTNVTFAPSSEKKETDFSFVRVAKNKAFWQQKNVITGLRAACVALAGLLFFQVVFSQRNHIAAGNPAIKMSFESLCQAIGCKIESFKNIDAFKIDSSSFQKAQITAGESASAEVFALKLTLKNSSDIPVAMPAVELTLTEAGDKPVLRRVLLAQELGFTDTTLAANADWTGEMKLAVTANPALVPISGYRVLLFYP